MKAEAIERLITEDRLRRLRSPRTARGPKQVLHSAATEAGHQEVRGCTCRLCLHWLVGADDLGAIYRRKPNEIIPFIPGVFPGAVDAP